MASVKHVLVSVVGLAPQVITETLYYFWCCASPAIPVTEAFALTTHKGKQRIDQTQIQRAVRMLSQHYSLPEITFDESHVHILRCADGGPLVDISTTQDNQLAADQVFQFVRGVTQSPDTHVHASIAGGRKTLGVYLALAMQFYGRPGDTLSHVLVSPEREADPEFFYPSPDSEQKDGQVELASIPLLFLRDKIPLLQGHTDTNYTELVHHVQQEYDALQELPDLAADRASRTLRIGTVVIRTTPLEFALYTYFVQRRLRCDAPDCHGCLCCSVAASDIQGGELQESLRETLKKLGADDPRYQLSGWDEDAIVRFNQTRSKINGQIKRAVPPFIPSHFYCIERLGNFPGWGNARYAVQLPKSRIYI